MKYIRRSKMSLSKRATLWITVCSFLQRGISFITVPLFTRLLTTAQYGEVSNYFSWSNVAYTVILLGVTYGGFNNGMVKYENDRDGYTESVIGLSTVMVLGWLALTLLFPGLVQSVLGMPRILTILLLVEILVKAYFDVWMCRQRYDFAYKRVVSGSLVLSIAAPVLGMIMVYLSQDKVLARVVSFVLVEAVLGVFALAACTHKSRSFAKMEYWKFTLTFNIPLIPYYLSQTAISQMDVIMITRMDSPAAAGIYNIANNCALVVMILVTSINSVLTPWIYHRMSEKQYGAIGNRTVELLCILAAGIFLLEAVAPEIMAILAPPRYHGAMSIIPVVSSCAFFILMYSFCVDTQLFFEQKRYASISSIVIAAVKFISNLGLIYVFGFQAAAYATLCCYILMAVFHYYYAKKICVNHIGINPYNGKVLFGLSAMVLAFAGFVTLTYDLPLVRWGIILSIFVIAFVKRDFLITRIKEFKQ